MHGSSGDTQTVVSFHRISCYFGVQYQAFQNSPSLRIAMYLGESWIEDILYPTLHVIGTRRQQHTVFLGIRTFHELFASNRLKLDTLDHYLLGHIEGWSHTGVSLVVAICVQVDCTEVKQLKCMSPFSGVEKYSGLGGMRILVGVFLC